MFDPQRVRDPKVEDRCVRIAPTTAILPKATLLSHRCYYRRPHQGIRVLRSPKARYPESRCHRVTLIPGEGPSYLSQLLGTPGCPLAHASISGLPRVLSPPNSFQIHRGFPQASIASTELQQHDLIWGTPATWRQATSSFHTALTKRHPPPPITSSSQFNWNRQQGSQQGVR